MKNLILFVAAILILSLGSCQKEEETQAVNPQLTLSKASTLSGLILRVSQNPTHYDNVLDNTSGFSVVLPVTVTVDGQTVTVDKNNDYDAIASIKNQSNLDDDIVHFSFPITLKYPNYEEVVVLSQYQFNTLYDNCGPENNFNEISCIDFNFPFKINTYNTTTQAANALTIANSRQLYSFIDLLKTDDLYSIVYAVSMTKSDSSTVVYNDNDQLQHGIENVINECDSPNNGDPELADIIVDGTWYVSSFIDDDHDETYHFSGYTFTFSANGTAIAVRNATTANGTWSSVFDGGFSKLYLNFSAPSLEEVGEDWRVIEYNDTLIKLSHMSGGGGNGDMHYLTFTKN